MKSVVLIFALALSSVVSSGNSEVNEPNNSQTQCQCWAVTKSGNRCKRRARPNEKYCKQHSANVSPTKPISRCRSMTEAGAQCQEKPVEGTCYCSKHLSGK